MARRASSSRAGFLGGMASDFVFRILIPTAIVVFWAGMMTHLVTREIVPGYVRASQTLVDPDILLAQWQPIQEWSWIQYNDMRVGGTGLVIDKRYESPAANARWVGYELRQNTYVEVTLPGAPPIPVTARIVIEFTKEFHIAEFAASVTGSALGMECQGFVSGGRLYYRYTTDGVEYAVAGKNAGMSYGYLDVGTRPLDLSEAVKPLLAHQGSLRVGDTYSVRVFNPLGDLAAQEARVVVAGAETLSIDNQTVHVLRLETTVDGLPPRKSWVDEAGVTQRRQLAFGYMTEHGGGEVIRQEYPMLDAAENLRMPVLDRKDFIRRAEAAGTGEPDGAQALGLLGAFLRAL